MARQLRDACKSGGECCTRTQPSLGDGTHPSALTNSRPHSTLAKVVATANPSFSSASSPHTSTIRLHFRVLAFDLAHEFALQQCCSPQSSVCEVVRCRQWEVGDIFFFFFLYPVHCLLRRGLTLDFTLLRGTLLYTDVLDRHSNHYLFYEL